MAASPEAMSTDLGGSQSQDFSGELSGSLAPITATATQGMTTSGLLDPNNPALSAYSGGDPIPGNLPGGGSIEPGGPGVSSATPANTGDPSFTGIDPTAGATIGAPPSTPAGSSGFADFLKQFGSSALSSLLGGGGSGSLPSQLGSAAGTALPYAGIYAAANTAAQNQRQLNQNTLAPLNNEASTLLAQAHSQLNQFSSSSLTDSQQAQLDAYAQQQKQQVAQRLTNGGVVDSSALETAYQQIDNNTLIMKQQFVQQALTNALNLESTAMQPLTTAISETLNSDTQISNTMTQLMGTLASAWSYQMAQKGGGTTVNVNSGAGGSPVGNTGVSSGVLDQLASATGLPKSLLSSMSNSVIKQLMQATNMNTGIGPYADPGTLANIAPTDPGVTPIPDSIVNQIGDQNIGAIGGGDPLAGSDPLATGSGSDALSGFSAGSDAAGATSLGTAAGLGTGAAALGGDAGTASLAGLPVLDEVTVTGTAPSAAEAATGAATDAAGAGTADAAGASADAGSAAGGASSAAAGIGGALAATQLAANVVFPALLGSSSDTPIKSITPQAGVSYDNGTLSTSNGGVTVSSTVSLGGIPDRPIITGKDGQTWQVTPTQRTPGSTIYKPGNVLKNLATGQTLQLTDPKVSTLIGLPYDQLEQMSGLINSSYQE